MRAVRADEAVERAYGEIAEDYARRGYRVVRSGTPGTIPAFLRDYEPDLIAERDGDHVIVEVKRTRSLRGSNDLRQLAARVAEQPGWRLELVALGKDADDCAVLAEPGWMDAQLQLPERFSTDPDMLVYSMARLGEVLDFLIQGLASVHQIKHRGKSPLRIAQELTFQGVIDQALLHRIEQVMRWREDRIHGQPTLRSITAQTAEMTALCRELHAQVQTAANQTRQA